MSVEADVLARDDSRCFRCGRVAGEGYRSCHHRQLRSGRGGDGPENRVTLCGSGTTGCHGWVHAHPQDSRDEGWMVSRYGNPEDVPVRHHQLGMVWLTPDLRVITEAEKEARET